MKVLHLINGFHVGGAEKLLSEYLLFQKKNDDSNHIVCTLYKVNTFILNKLVENDIEVIELECKSKFDITKIYDLIKYIKLKKIEIVHVHLFPSLYFAAIASIFLPNIKFIYTEHSTSNKRRNYKILRRIEKTIYNRYDKIICCSNNVKLSLCKWIPTIESKCSVVNNAINSIDIIQREKIFDFILIGSMRSNVKGFDIFLNALATIKDDSLKIAILGDGMLRDELKKQAISLNLINNVEFLGNKSDVSHYLAMSKIFILSSRWEGLPLALLEAMASGLACICTDVGEVSSIIDNEKNGIIVPPNDEEKLASAMEKLLRSELIQKKIGENAKRTFEEKFTMDIYSKNITYIYKNYKDYRGVVN